MRIVRPSSVLGATTITCLIVLLVSSAAMASSVRGAPAVIAEDDFSTPGSGTGWAVGDDWDGAVSGGVATVRSGSVFRAFANSIDTTTIDKLYITFDITRSDAQFAGVPFFNEGAEEVFTGRPFLADQYGFDVIDGDITTGGPPIDLFAPRLILEVDFDGGTGGTDLIRIFVDNFDFSNPDALAEVTDTFLPDTMTQLRIATDGLVVIDNLVVADNQDAAIGLIFSDGFESGDTSAW